MLLTDKYADKIYGTITCYDRMIIQGLNGSVSMGLLNGYRAPINTLQQPMVKKSSLRACP